MTAPPPLRPRRPLALAAAAAVVLAPAAPYSAAHGPVAGGGTPVRWTPARLSTSAYESSPAFTPDGRELYFMRADRDFRRYRLLWSRCGPDGWTTPAAVPFAAPTSADDADPAVTADGRRLYFVSTRPAPGRASGADDFDVWMVERASDGTWGTPRRLPPPVNSPSSELLPRPGPGGVLYFGSDRAGGYGQTDIYVAAPTTARRGAGWHVGNVGPPVSTGANEYEADVSRDGRTLVVVADRGDRSHLYRFARVGGTWAPRGRVAARPDVFQVGPLLSPRADRLLFAQADPAAGGARSGEFFLTDLAVAPDRTWPPRCAGGDSPGPPR